MNRIGIARKYLEAAWKWLFGFDIFITYTRRDGEPYTLSLEAALANEFLVFLDTDAIKGGERIEDRIIREILRCRLHVVVLTPEAADDREAPWVSDEVKWHFEQRRRARILTIFFPPNTPANLPRRLERLALYKGVMERPGAEHAGSVSIRVLEAIAGRQSPTVVEEMWRRDALLYLGHTNEKHIVAEVRHTFRAVRQRVVMRWTAIVFLLVCGLGIAMSSLALTVTQKRLVIASQAQGEQENLRFLEAERLWLQAANVAPWGQANFLEKWRSARERRLLTPTACRVLPSGWRARAIGSQGHDWRLFAHRDNEGTNGLAAVAGPGGWVVTVPTADDANPQVLFQDGTAYVHAAGKIFRIPLDQAARATLAEKDLGLKSYHFVGYQPQIELGWKAGRLCVLAGQEDSPQVFLLDPVTLQIESRINLALPTDPPEPTGHAVFRLSTRSDTLVVATGKRHTEDTVEVTSWDLDGRPKPLARRFALPMDAFGRTSSPSLETMELSPNDEQIFVRVAATDFGVGDSPRTAQVRWLALDTVSNRPAFLMEPMISALFPLRAHQRLEAYYEVEGGNLRALTFPDFVVLARPSVGVLSGVRAEALLPIPDTTGDTLAATNDAHEIILVRQAKPVFRLTMPPTAERPGGILGDASGHWLAVPFDADTDTTPQRVMIYAAGPPTQVALPDKETPPDKIEPVALPLGEPPAAR